MKALPTWRLTFLSVVFGGGILTLAKVLFFPPAPPSQAYASLFSGAPELMGWQFDETTPLDLQERGQGELITAATYTYTQEEHNLAIDMHYLVHLDPNLRNLMLKYGKNTPAATIESTLRHNEFGYYSIFSDAAGTYLSSCINPTGGTTVTAAQFTQNRYTNDLRPERFLPILLGQTTLQDARCLWVHMTLPTEAELTSEEASAMLEAVWPAWYSTWQANFPDP